ncbi:hypothetical protein CBL_12025 [Carabus blaptoides fortunei]
MASTAETLLEARTVLIPKKQAPKEPGDFRPLSISSVLSRCLHKILAKRVGLIVPISAKQSAFRPVDGCSINTFLVDKVLKHHREHFKPLYMATTDMAKAYDSITHESLRDTMLHYAFPAEMVAYVMSTYHHGWTRLACDGWESEPRLIDISSESLGTLGLLVNPAKSHTVAMKNIPGRKKCAIDAKQTFRCGSHTLPALSREDEWTYLGIPYSPEGRIIGCVASKLALQLATISKDPLKPQQRLFALRTFIVPATYHQLTLGKTHLGFLMKLDNSIRRAVRKWLALPLDCPSAYVHADHKDGGLSVLVITPDQAHVIDAQVINEHYDLNKAHQTKSNKYKTLSVELRELSERPRILFGSATLNWKGLWSSESVRQHRGSPLFSYPTRSLSAPPAFRYKQFLLRRRMPGQWFLVGSAKASPTVPPSSWGSA